MSHKTDDESLPFVSVVIPAHNEGKFITDCIDSVLANDWPHDRLEILVIDHSSTDSTATLARAAGAPVISIQGGNIGTVRNVGLKASKGDIIAYVDGDCTVPATWIRTAVNILGSDKTIGAVGGPCLSPAGGTWIEHGLAPSSSRAGVAKSANTLATSSLILRTALLREIGGFDELLLSGEDDQLSNRIRARGLSLVSASDCHIVHYGYPRTWRELIAKERWHGSNHLEVRSEFDLTLILSVVFLLSSLVIPILLSWTIFARDELLFLVIAATLSLQAISPILYAAKRTMQSPRDFRFAVSFLAVGYAYFAGHGLGVSANYLRKLRSVPSISGRDSKTSVNK